MHFHIRLHVDFPRRPSKCSCPFRRRRTTRLCRVTVTSEHGSYGSRDQADAIGTAHGPRGTSPSASFARLISYIWFQSLCKGDTHIYTHISILIYYIYVFIHSIFYEVLCLAILDARMSYRELRNFCEMMRSLGYHRLVSMEPPFN